MDSTIILKAQKRDPEALKQVFKYSDEVLNQYLANWNYNINPNALKAKSRALTIKALDSYDPTKGTAFKSHLYNHFKKLSRTIMYYNDIVRMPENQRLKVGALQRVLETLRDELGRDPSIQELSDYLGWNIKETERILKNITYDMPENDSLPTVHAHYDPKELIMHQIYQDLSPRDQVVFEHTVGFHGKPILPAKEIAKKLNISEGMVTHIKKNIGKMLEEHMKKAGIL